jgi:hypothetical protein
VNDRKLHAHRRARFALLRRHTPTTHHPIRLQCTNFELVHLPCATTTAQIAVILQNWPAMDHLDLSAHHSNLLTVQAEADYACAESQSRQNLHYGHEFGKEQPKLIASIK